MSQSKESTERRELVTRGRISTRTPSCYMTSSIMLNTHPLHLHIFTFGIFCKYYVLYNYTVYSRILLQYYTLRPAGKAPLTQNNTRVSITDLYLLFIIITGCKQTLKLPVSMSTFRCITMKTKTVKIHLQIYIYIYIYIYMD